MKNLIVGIFIFWVAGNLLAQNTEAKIDFDNFTPLTSQGILPFEVEMSGKDFVETSRNSVMAGGNKFEKRSKAQFLLESSYSIKELFVSGRVLYNDPISHYLEKVRLEITASDSLLRKNTKIFVVKSSVVNAFATNQGYIFVTTGLLALLNNEAELAFILCHELIHYQKQHVLKGYVYNEKLDRSGGGYRKSSIDEHYIDKVNFSKENESEADVLGFDLFLKTSYALEAIDGTFDVLKFSELPFADTEFAPSFLESEYLKIPAEYLKEEVREREGEDEDYDDLFSTHPNLSKRRSDIKDKLDGLSVEKKAKPRRLFVVSEDEFIYARKLSRFDLCHSNLINRNYDKAFYEAYCLLQDNPNSIYLKKVVLKALYGLTKYKNAERFSEVALKYKRVEGQGQRFNYLIDQLEKNELNVVTLNYAWRLKKSLAVEDPEVNAITDDIFYEMVKRYYPEKTFFSDSARVIVIDSTVIKEQQLANAQLLQPLVEPVSKFTKDNQKPVETYTPKSTKKKKKKKKPTDEEYFITYAFVDLLRDSSFIATYDKVAKQAKRDKTEETKEESMRKAFGIKKSISFEDFYGENQFIVDERRLAMKYNSKWDCYAMGIDRVLFLNPFYYRVDERKKNPLLYKGTEEAQKEFNNQITTTANVIGLDVELLDRKQFTIGSVENYNEMGVLLDWMDERIDHRKIKIIPTDYTQMQAIAKKYKTDYLGVIGAVNYIEKKRNVGFHVALSVLVPVYTWIYTFPYLFTKKSETYVYTVVYNMKTGQSEMSTLGKATLADDHDVIGSFIYDHLSQIKRSGDKRNK